MFLSVPNTSLAPLRGAPRPAVRSRHARHHAWHRHKNLAPIEDTRIGFALRDRCRHRATDRAALARPGALSWIVYMGLAAHTPPLLTRHSDAAFADTINTRSVLTEPEFFTRQEAGRNDNRLPVSFECSSLNPPINRTSPEATVTPVFT